MTTSVATDTAQNMLSAAQWELLAPYLQPINLAASEVLFAEGHWTAICTWWSTAR